MIDCDGVAVWSDNKIALQGQTPTEDEVKDWMMGNLCRCTGYYQILESIAAAAHTEA